MAQTEKELVSDLIAIIANAEQPGSISNEMVARVLDFLYKNYCDALKCSGAIEKETTARVEADVKLAQSINDLRDTLDAVIGKNETSAIDNLKEIVKFLDGFKDSDNLAATITGLRDKIANITTSFAHTTILPFDGILSGGDAVPGFGIWYVAGEDRTGHFEVMTNDYGHTDNDYNSRTPGGAVYPVPGRVWVCTLDGRLYMSQGLRIVPMLTAGDLEFNPATASLNINIDSKWL